MRPAMTQLSISTARADALFVSALQRSDEPGVAAVREAVRTSVRKFGFRGCAGRVAQEFGDHPDLAVGRMRWARELVAAAFPGPAPRESPHAPGPHPVRRAARRAA
jgi:hypothetical protein